MPAQPALATPVDFGLTGLTILVTGSTSGIGRALADGFVRAGAHVFYHGKTLNDAIAAARSGGGTPLACDLTDSRAVDAMCDTLLASSAGLDVLVNNAGVEMPGRLEVLDDDLVRSTMEVNLVAPVRLIRRLLPLLKESRNASVLNVSSIHDRVPSHSNSAYGASKAALRMVTETLAIELGPQAIRVNALAPGAIETDINRGILARIGAAAFADLIPLGRVGSVDDVVGPAVFLTSSAARYVSGATLVVDGAYSLHLVRYRGLGEH